MKKKKNFQTLAGFLIFFLIIESAAIIAAASQVFIWWHGIAGIEPPLSLYCWFPYFSAYKDDPVLKNHLLICIAVPTAGFLAFDSLLLWAFFQGRRKRRLRPAKAGQVPNAPVRALSDSFGNADWLPMNKLQALFPGPSPEYGGIVVGEAYRVDQTDVAKVPFKPDDPKTWGQGGKAPLLIDPCKTGSTHGAIFAGSGGFKTTSVVIPTLLHWTGSAVVLDPACQIAPMIKQAREDMGHKVVVVKPGKGFNVLSWINLADPLAETHVTDVVHQLDGGDPQDNKGKSENEMFETRGRELMTCLLADLLWSDLPAEQKNLREFRVRLTTPEKEMKPFLQKIYSGSKSPLARQLAGSLMGVFSETFSGIYSHATASTQWLGIKAFADMVSEGDFDPAALKSGKLTICLQIPMSSLRSNPALGRLTLGTLLNVVYQAEGQIKGRVLYLLDEVNLLGRLKALADARDGARKYGVTLLLIWQSVGQVEGTWGKAGKTEWYNSLSWRIYAGVDDPDTQREISLTCGTYTIITVGEGENRSSNSGIQSASRSYGTSQNISERPRELIRAEEVSTTMRLDEQIMFVKNTAPVRCGRAIYFRRPEMVKVVNDDPFIKKDANAAE